MSSATQNYENISGGVQFLATRIGSVVAGPFGAVYATFLTGQNSWVASASDLVSKVNAGTATWEDYADVASRTMSTAVAFGVLAGALPATTSLLGLTTVVGGALTLWKNKDLLLDMAGQPGVISPSSNAFASLPIGEQQQLNKFLNDLFPLTGEFEQQDAMCTKLQAQFKTALTVAIDPLVLDLDGDGVETTTLSKTLIGGVNFNLDAKGLAEKTGWVGKDDGLLVRDLDGDGKITSGRELFGNHALLKSSEAAANDIWRQAA